MARLDPQVNFRMPAALKKRLEEAAFENKRSVTAEIVARLEASFRPPSGKIEVKNPDGSVTVVSRGVIESIVQALSKVTAIEPGGNKG